MKKFELFMCCLGNGTTICNKAVEEYGDYKNNCTYCGLWKNRMVRETRIRSGG